MPRFTMSIVVNAPITEVFTAFADIEHAAERVQGIKKIEMLTTGPIGIGTKFKETRVIFKREATETFEFTTYEPHQRYEMMAISCGAEYRTTFQFTPEGNGTRVDATFTTKAITLLAKLFQPLGFLMAGPMKKCILADMNDIKRFAEGHATPTA